MDYMPGAFNTPVWYIVVHLNGASGLLTQKRYYDLLAGQLNKDQKNALIKVEEYLLLPDTLYLVIREEALKFDMWWPLFRDTMITQLNERWGSELKARGEEVGTLRLSWENETYEQLTSAEAFEHRANEMLFLPVRKGLAADPEFYPLNSVNNKAGIDL